eukprot:GEZU01021929.1.p1 GENE.GEZU01021929.1~~GEZU01021929.1.p1  ORF type:complete len:397 (+),score=51.17 GEZU01021929.1:154-1344(+)
MISTFPTMLHAGASPETATTSLQECLLIEEFDLGRDLFCRPPQSQKLAPLQCHVVHEGVEYNLQVQIPSASSVRISARQQLFESRLANVGSWSPCSSTASSPSSACSSALSSPVFTMSTFSTAANSNDTETEEEELYRQLHVFGTILHANHSLPREQFQAATSHNWDVQQRNPAPAQHQQPSFQSSSAFVPTNSRLLAARAQRSLSIQVPSSFTTTEPPSRPAQLNNGALTTSPVNNTALMRSPQAFQASPTRPSPRTIPRQTQPQSPMRPQGAPHQTPSIRSPAKRLHSCMEPEDPTDVEADKEVEQINNNNIGSTASPTKATRTAMSRSKSPVPDTFFGNVTPIKRRKSCQDIFMGYFVLMPNSSSPNNRRKSLTLVSSHDQPKGGRVSVFDFK